MRAGNVFVLCCLRLARSVHQYLCQCRQAMTGQAGVGVTDEKIHGLCGISSEYLLSIDIVLALLSVPLWDDVRPLSTLNLAALDTSHGVTDELDEGVGGDLVELTLVLDLSDLNDNNAGTDCQ